MACEAQYEAPCDAQPEAQHDAQHDAQLDARYEAQPDAQHQAQHPVVILYKHALLGEGIAKYLRAQCGVEAALAPARDHSAVASALARDPAVVIFELSGSLREVDLGALAPHAVLIDISTVVTRGLVLTPDVAGLDRILQAVRYAGPPPGVASGPSRESDRACTEIAATSCPTGSVPDICAVPGPAESVVAGV